MLVQECQKPLAVTKSTTGDGDGTVDAADSTPCPNDLVPIEQMSPLLVGNPQSLSAATLAKCSVAATKYRGQLLRLLLGITLVTSALAIWLLDPVELYIRKMLAFHEGSFLFENWRDPIIPINHKIYVFNVTNTDGFLYNGEKLRVEEVGPYTYTETLKNIVVQFNDNGTMTYIPNRTEAFADDLSERNAREDIVVVPNIALIAFVSILHNSPFYIKWFALRTLAQLHFNPFISVTVNDLMMGYDDSLVTLGNTFLSNMVPISKLGVLDLIRRPNDTITMFINPDDPSRTDPKIYTMDLMNGSPGLDYWGYGKTLVETDNGTLVPELRRCNAARGTYEGVILPRYLPENQILWIFRKYFCRPLPAIFDKHVTAYGLKLRQYKLKDDAFDAPDKNPENSCYCDDNKGDCLPSGLAIVTPCYFNVPAASSNPHFLYGDESLIKAIDGIAPDKEKHDSYFSVLTELGVPFQGNCKTQINLIARTSGLKSIAIFHNMILPIIWFDTVIGPYPDDLMFLMRLAVNEGPVIQKVLAVLFFISGLILVLIVTARYFYPLNHMKTKLNVIRFRHK